VRFVAAQLSKTKTDCERLHEVRTAKKLPGTDIHDNDDILAHPEQFANPLLRFLIHASNFTAQAGEFTADFSGFVDKVMRNAVSGGKKKDIGMVFGSMCGRLATMNLNMLGFAIHKSIGAGLFAVASMLSFSAVFLAQSSVFGRRVSVEKTKRFEGDVPVPPRSLRSDAPLPFQSIQDKFFINVFNDFKERAVSRVGQNLIEQGSSSHWPLHFSQDVSRFEHSPEKKRLFNSAYMWENLGQYHGITRFLMITAHGLHTLVNRFCISQDKHLACWITKHRFMQYCFGGILGERMANALTTAAAVVVSVFASQLVVGFAAMGAMACALAIVLMLLAKGTAFLEYKVLTKKYAEFPC
jgi:hypothetical protein